MSVNQLIPGITAGDLSYEGENMIKAPKIEYPKCLYDAKGNSVTVHNETEEKAHAERGWMPTPPPKPPVEIPTAAKAAPATDAAAFGVPQFVHERAVEQIMSLQDELKVANQKLGALQLELEAKGKELEETKAALDTLNGMYAELEGKTKAQESAPAEVAAPTPAAEATKGKGKNQ